ncbi:MAG: PP2C family protein-serine/threonine phosphatase, partial [Desulfovibrionaceae bacterium]
TSMAIGFDPDVEFPERTVELAPGDRFYLYTDGVVEARSAEDEEFGEQRMAELLEKHRHQPLKESMRRVDQDVEAFAKDINDDRTLVGAEVVG